MNQQLEVNVLRRGPITYYSTNFHQYKNFYDFCDEKPVDSFFNSVKELFVSGRGKEFKMQGYFELKNYQQTELENTRMWLKNVFIGRYFNEFIRSEMKKDILKKVIINSSTGSSWLFKRFIKLQVIVTDKNSLKNMLSS